VEALRGDPGLGGALVVGLALDGKGRVAEVRTEIDSLRAPEILSCVVSEMKATQFPRGPERVSVAMRFARAP